MAIRLISFFALSLCLMGCPNLYKQTNATLGVKSQKYEECRMPFLFNDTLAYLNPQSELVYFELDSVKTSWELLYPNLELEPLGVMEARDDEPAFVLASRGKNLNAFVYTPILKKGDAFFFDPDSEYNYHVVLCVCNQKIPISQVALFIDGTCCNHKGCTRTDIYTEIRNCREILPSK